MNKSEKLFEKLKADRLIALLTPKNAEDCVKAYEILNPLGVVLEVAFRSEYAQEGIEKIMEKYPDASIMAGTVMTKQQAEVSIQSGVSGIVSADYIPDVVEICVQNDVMCIPGGLSDAGKQLVKKAEIYKCSLDDLKGKYPYQWIYKLFPAVTSSGSNTGLVSAFRGPYKGLNVVYTGGVNLSNLKELSDNDPMGIFCGSALTKKIDEPELMKAETEKWLSVIHKKQIIETPEKSPIKHTEKVVTFGEIMLRLSPPNNLRFVQTKSFDINYGGAEANTAVAFANYGLDSLFVTALPENEIGQSAINSLRAFGVNTTQIKRQGSRIGIYYFEYGVSQRPSKVIYDRAASSISELEPGEIDWENIFKDASWFHWSGITPALSKNAAEVTREALISAKNAGVTVSVDLNYRKKLWTPDEACSVMTGLMEFVDVCIGNEEDAEKMFGLKSGSTDVEKGKLDEAGYEETAKLLIDKFGLNRAAITLRESISASDNIWSACLHNGKEFMISKKYNVHLVDRVGGGDSFSSGLIYSLMTGRSDRDSLEFGTAASCLKQTIHGDYNHVTVSEIGQIMKGKTSGRIQR